MFDFEHPQLKAGLRYHKQGNWGAARSCYLLALHDEPINARYLLGELAYAQEQSHEALRYFEAVLAKAPEHPHALLMMGNLAVQAQNFLQAETYFLQALKSDPELHGVHLSLAEAYRGQKKLQQALNHFQNYLYVFPDDPRAWRGQLYIWQSIGHTMRQIRCLEKLQQLTPWETEISEGLILNWPYCFQLDHADKLLSLIENRAPRWLQNLSPRQRLDYDKTELHWRYHRYFLDYINPKVSDQTLFKNIPHSCFKPSTKPYTARQNQVPLKRIAYLSQEFGRYSTSRQLEPLLQHHKAQYELYAYDTGSQEDHEHQRLKTYVQHWRNVKGLKPAEIAAQLQHDGIQILVDMGGLVKMQNKSLLALQAVPIQVTGPAFLFSGGHTHAQYCFSDSSLCPPHIAALYPEEICYLDTALHLTPPPEHPLSPSPWGSGTATQLTLGSANNPLKFNQQVLNLWIRLLKLIPHCQLYLKSTYFDDPELKHFYFALFEGHDLKARVRIEGSREDGAEAHLTRFYNAVDIALDPFPYQGGITSLDALWMGVPVVVMQEPRWQARALGVSIYQHLGLDDWLVNSEDMYIQRVLAWASQPEFLNQQRQTLRAKLRDSSIFKGKQYTLQVEAHYEKMWAAYHKQKA